MLVQNEAYSNFANSINSEQTRKIYEYSLTRLLKHHEMDLDSFLRLPQQDISNLIIISGKKKRKYYDSFANLIPDDDLDAIRDMQGGRRIVYYKEDKIEDPK